MYHIEKVERALHPYAYTAPWRVIEESSRQEVIEIAMDVAFLETKESKTLHPSFFLLADYYELEPRHPSEVWDQLAQHIELCAHCAATIDAFDTVRERAVTNLERWLAGTPKEELSSEGRRIIEQCHTREEVARVVRGYYAEIQEALEEGAAGSNTPVARLYFCKCSVLQCA